MLRWLTMVRFLLIKRKAIEQFRSGNEDIRQEGIATLKKMNPTISKYFDIEGTDAQEYTTWKEHFRCTILSR